jgi:hypothetical protein
MNFIEKKRMFAILFFHVILVYKYQGNAIDLYCVFINETACRKIGNYDEGIDVTVAVWYISESQYLGETIN